MSSLIVVFLGSKRLHSWGLGWLNGSADLASTVASKQAVGQWYKCVDVICNIGVSENRGPLL